MAVPKRIPRPKRKILLILSPKGGAGKTTLSLNLLVAAANAGNNVVGVDFDPQRTLLNWATVRDQQQIEPSIPVITGDAVNWRASLDLDADLTVIDTPPVIDDHNIASVMGLLGGAHLTMIPSGQGTFDINSVVGTTERLARSGQSKILYCLNRVNPRSRSFGAAKEELMAVGPLCPMELPQYEDIQALPGAGLSCLDGRGRKGASQVQAIWAHVKRELGL